jgi:hypothetical protein
MTNPEAYFRETKQLERDAIEQEWSGRIRHRTVKTNQSLFGPRSYRREQLPSGCILYKLTAKQENHFCEPENSKKNPALELPIRLS